MRRCYMELNQQKTSLLGLKITLSFFIVLTHLLGSVAIARAAFAFTDMFKTSILNLHEKTPDSQSEDKQPQEDINHLSNKS